MTDRLVYIETEHDTVDCNLASLVPQHAMKPYRILATSELVEALGIKKHCRVISPPAITLSDLKEYHSSDYLNNMKLFNSFSWRWHPDESNVSFSGDCPPVEGILEHSMATAAGTLAGAVLLNSGEADVAIHWGGGMHHARCGECSGFCYINDIVLGIIELLKVHERVLYIDLDVHHGDGVDEAFCQSDRVFTLSLHKYGDSFFPGTGHPLDIGVNKGRYYSMNLALWDGINDFYYVSTFEYALKSVINKFKPNCVVLQCGADSLANDRLGVFNLSSVGHGRCVQMVSELRLPLLVIGGGGYTICNVAKLWAYETSILCGVPVPPNTIIPWAEMRQSGWLFEGFPYLLVASDQTNQGLSGSNVPRMASKVQEQIDRHVLHL